MNTCGRGGAEAEGEDDLQCRPKSGPYGELGRGTDLL